MKRAIQIVKHNSAEFTLEELEKFKALILNIPKDELIIGSQFVLRGCVFQIIGMQYNFDLNIKIIAVAQITSNSKITPVKNAGNLKVVKN